MSPKIV